MSTDGKPSKHDARRALAVALARAHADIRTANLNLNELAVMAVVRGLPASPDVLELAREVVAQHENA